MCCGRVFTLESDPATLTVAATHLCRGSVMFCACLSTACLTLNDGQLGDLPLCRHPTEKLRNLEELMSFCYRIVAFRQDGRHTRMYAMLCKHYKKFGWCAHHRCLGITEAAPNRWTQELRDETKVIQPDISEQALRAYRSLEITWAREFFELSRRSLSSCKRECIENNWSLRLAFRDV